MQAQLLPLSLGGYRERPPQERMEARLAGWQKTFRLAMDLLRDGMWSVRHQERRGGTVVIGEQQYEAK